MPFHNHLQVELTPGSASRKLMLPLIYISLRKPLANGKSVIEVVRGFKTDFASIPRFLWAIFPPDAGDTRRAATLHDFLYCQPHCGFTRAQADGLFRIALKEDGAGFVKRWLFWVGVRLGGGLHWAR